MCIKSYGHFLLSLFFQVKERPDVGVYIKDLSAYVVNNADDMDRIMTLGHKNRKWQCIIVIEHLCVEQAFIYKNDF